MIDDASVFIREDIELRTVRVLRVVQAPTRDEALRKLRDAPDAYVHRVTLAGRREEVRVGELYDGCGVSEMPRDFGYCDGCGRLLPTDRVRYHADHKRFYCRSACVPPSMQATVGVAIQPGGA